jgi:hypothetical protein
MSGTATGLIAFLDWAARTGELSPNTVAAYKTAVTQVLEIDGEAWGNTRVRELDLDRQLDRFARLRASRYSAASLRTYGNRVRAAITHYLKYLEAPTAFRTGQPKVARTTTSGKPRTGEPAAAVTGGKSNGRASSTPSAELTAPGDLVQYPFPLRSGLMAYLSLPRDLRRSEAQRIAAFVASLAVDPVTELGPVRVDDS